MRGRDSVSLLLGVIFYIAASVAAGGNIGSGVGFLGIMFFPLLFLIVSLLVDIRKALE